MSDSPSPVVTAPGPPPGLMAAVAAQNQMANAPVAAPSPPAATVAAPTPTQPTAPVVETPTPPTTKGQGDLMDSVPDAAPEPVVETPVPTPEATAKEHAITRYKRESEEYQKLKPKHDELVAELEQLRGRPQTDPAVQAELEELRAYRAAQDITATPIWKENIGAKLETQDTLIQQIAQVAKVPPEKLATAMEEPNPLARNRAIAALLREGGEEILDAELNLAYKVGDDRHETYKGWATMKKDAESIFAERDGRQSVERQRREQEASAQYAQVHQSVFETLSARATGELMKDSGFAESLKAARLPEDAKGRAYYAIAGHLLPKAVEQVMSLRKEIANLKAQQKAMDTARPGIGTGVPASPSVEAQKLTLQQATQAHLGYGAMNGV